MKTLIFSICILFLISCSPTNKRTHRLTLESVTGPLESTDIITLAHDGDYKVYRIYTQTNAQEAYCVEGYGREKIAVPISYCLSLKAQAQKEILEEVNLRQ